MVATLVIGAAAGFIGARFREVSETEEISLPKIMAGVLGGLGVAAMVLPYEPTWLALSAFSSIAGYVAYDLMDSITHIAGRQ